MAAKVGDFSLILKLLGGIIIGALLGLYIGENAEGSLKHVMDVVDEELSKLGLLDNHSSEFK